jgi:hypothetical protein
MGQDQDPRDRAGIEPASEEDSSAEMQIISEVFGDQKPAAGDQVFALDLFGAPNATAPVSTAPAPPSPPGETAAVIKPVSPAGTDDLWSEPGPATAITIADAASVFGEPEDDIPIPPPPAPKSPEAAESIKVVTDDDLRKLFDMSSPGFRPPAPPMEEAATTPEIPEPAAEPADEPAPPEGPASKSSWDEDTLGDQTAEVDLSRPIPEPEPEPEPDPQTEPGPRDTLAYFSNEGPPEPQSQPTDPDVAPPISSAPPEVPPVSNQRTDSDLDLSSDEIIDRLETAAVVGDMTAVAAGKKGSLLEQTESLMSKLEPTGDDFLSVDEMRKLFINVNTLADLVCESAKRIDELEKKLEQLEKNK